MLQMSLRQHIHVLCFSNMGSFRAVDKHYISSNDLYTCVYLDPSSYKKIMSFFCAKQPITTDYSHKPAISITVGCLTVVIVYYVVVKF